MAVTFPQLHWNGSTGEAVSEGGGVRTMYQAIYKLKTTDPLDNAQLILEFFVTDPNLPGLGAPYEYGNDSDHSALCYSIKPRRRRKNSQMWDVIVSYKTPDPDDEDYKPDENGDLTDNPLEWRPEFSVSHRAETRPVYSARYMGGFTGTAAERYPTPEDNTYRFVPMNSAFIPFDPPLEEVVTVRMVNITAYIEEFNGEAAATWHRALNERIVTIDLPWYYDWWGKYEARLEQVDASLERRFREQPNGQQEPIDFFQLNIMVAVDPDNHLKKVVDRGVAARAIVGDPDGRGSTISSQDLVEGMPRARHLVDADDNPITEPVLFDGDGAPLDVSDDDAEPVILSFATSDIRDFSEFYLLKDIVTPIGD